MTTKSTDPRIDATDPNAVLRVWWGDMDLGALATDEPEVLEQAARNELRGIGDDGKVFDGTDWINVDDVELTVEAVEHE